MLGQRLILAPAARPQPYPPHVHRRPRRKASDLIPASPRRAERNRPGHARSRGATTAAANTTAVTTTPRRTALLDDTHSCSHPASRPLPVKCPGFPRARARRDGSPRNWVVWLDLRSTTSWCALLTRSGRPKDMRPRSRVALSDTDLASPCRPHSRRCLYQVLQHPYGGVPGSRGRARQR
jgi:hypothetical protein